MNTLTRLKLFLFLTYTALSTLDSPTMFPNWSPKECARWQGRLNNWFNQRVNEHIDARTRSEFQVLMESFPMNSLNFERNSLDATFGIRHNPSGSGIWKLRDNELVPVSQCVLGMYIFL